MVNLVSLYNNYHYSAKIQNKVISEKNFTYRNLLSVLNEFRTGKRVLDIGSGVGTIDFYLASHGKRVTGIEIAQKAVDRARESAKLMGLESNVEFIKGDFLEWDTRKRFDMIICSEVLEHLKDDNRALVKIYDLLKKGGHVLITTPSQNAPLFLLGLAKEFDNRVGHLRRYQMDKLVSMLKQKKFIVLRKKKTEGILRNFLFVYKLGYFPNRLANKIPLISDILTTIDNILLRLFGESNLIIICKK